MANILLALHGTTLRNLIKERLEISGHYVVACASVDSLNREMKQVGAWRYHIAIIEASLPEKNDCIIRDDLLGKRFIEKFLGTGRCYNSSWPQRTDKKRRPFFYPLIKYGSIFLNWIVRPRSMEFILFTDIQVPISSKMGIVHKGLSVYEQLESAVRNALEKYWKRRFRRAVLSSVPTFFLFLGFFMQDMVRGVCFSYFSLTALAGFCLLLIYMNEIRTARFLHNN
jgi:hypothetical protein